MGLCLTGNWAVWTWKCVSIPAMFGCGWRDHRRQAFAGRKLYRPSGIGTHSAVISEVRCHVALWLFKSLLSRDADFVQLSFRWCDHICVLRPISHLTHTPPSSPLFKPWRADHKFSLSSLLAHFSVEFLPGIPRMIARILHWLQLALWSSGSWSWILWRCCGGHCCDSVLTRHH